MMKLAHLIFIPLLSIGTFLSFTSSAYSQADQASANLIETQGELAEGDGVLSDESLYDEYSFTGREGQRLTISLQSTEFQPYLLLIGADDSTIAQSETGQMTVTIPANGVYRVLANSLAPEGRGRYQLLVTTALQSGDIQATLRWESADDLDLIVVDPNGDTVYFDNTPVVSGGELDVDANAACDVTTNTPVENIFWPRSAAPQGEYRIAVNLYSRCTETQGAIPFTLTLQVQGQTQVLTGTVDEQNDLATFSAVVE
jgi:hypothetical protein